MVVVVVEEKKKKWWVNKRKGSERRAKAVHLIKFGEVRKSVIGVAFMIGSRETLREKKKEGKMK